MVRHLVKMFKKLLVGQMVTGMFILLIWTCLTEIIPAVLGADSSSDDQGMDTPNISLKCSELKMGQYPFW